MVTQDERSPGGPGPRHRPRDRARGERRLHLIGLEELVEHVRDGREDDPSKEVFGLRGANERCEVREGHGRCEQRRLDQFRELVPKTRVPGPGRGVLLRELRHLLPIPILVVPIEQEPPVREGLEEGMAAWLSLSFSPVRRRVSRQRLRALDAVPPRPPLQSRSASRVANTARRRWRSRCTASTAATSNRSWPTRSDDSPSTAAPSPAKVRPAVAGGTPLPRRKRPPLRQPFQRRPPPRAGPRA